MKVAIVGQRGNSRAVGVVSDVSRRLRDEGVAVALDEETHAELARRGDLPAEATDIEAVSVDAVGQADLVVSVGGDGTFLFSARGAGTTPIMGINLGEVGFLNAVAPGEAIEAVTAEVERLRETGSVRTRKLPRLSATGRDWTLPPALNEVVVQGAQRGHGNGATVEVRVDGSLYTSDHADGVIVATPTGSTAYNLSESGPLVHPDLEALVLTEMCGREAMPPLVLDADKTVTVRVADAESAVAVSDGRVSERVTPPATITLERADEPVFVAGPPLDFFTALGKLD